MYIFFLKKQTNDLGVHMGFGHFPTPNSTTPKIRVMKKYCKHCAHNCTSTLISVSGSMCVCVYIRRSQRAISSCLLPQWYQRPLHPLSHVSYDKMVSISAALRTGTSKITQAAWKYPMGKVNKDSIFSYDADCHSDRRQREGEVP